LDRREIVSIVDIVYSSLSPVYHWVLNKYLKIRVFNCGAGKRVANRFHSPGFQLNERLINDFSITSATTTGKTPSPTASLFTEVKMVIRNKV
jgi:hypothetical protein